MPNLLFAAYKPTGLSSNTFLGRLKRRYKLKKMGYSGTLDPFAKGLLVIASERYTSLFRFLSKAPKSYKATLWLGVSSPTLDIEQASSPRLIPPLDENVIRDVLASMIGQQDQIPPSYCAKKIDGVRAYDLARQGENVTLKSVPITIYDLSFCHYRHPFLTFEATVSEGTYIRKIGEDIAHALGTNGALSALERTQEGLFLHADETPLDPCDFIDLPRNSYLGDIQDLIKGKKLSVTSFADQTEGLSMVQYDNCFSIIEIEQSNVHYLINTMPRP